MPVPTTPTPTDSSQEASTSTAANTQAPLPQHQHTNVHSPPASATTSSAEAHAAALFDITSSHIPAWSPLLALYFPFGVVIAVLRISLWIAGVLIDAPWFRNPDVVRTYLALLGFKANWRNLNLLPPGRHVMVSNHVTPGDLMVLFQGLPQRYTHLITTALPPRVTATTNLPCALRFATPEVLEQLAAPPPAPAAGRQPQQPEQPVHLFPEGGVTNGRWGMMQFTRGFTRLLRPGDWVVPVALRARTPWDIRTHTLLSSFPANLFWLSFCPWVEMEAVVLQPLQQLEGESRGAFAKRVQQSIADELGQVVSECNITVKKRIMQRESKTQGTTGTKEAAKGP